jgi:methyl-accepting chemotaxis protein
MSIRLRVFLSIVGIVSIIVLTTMGISLHFVRQSLEKTVGSGISLVSAIADSLVTTEINLLKAKATTTAHRLMDAPEADWLEILKEQTAGDPLTLGVAVFDREGLVLSYGNAPTPADLADSPYIRRAFAGEAIISTTRKDPGGKLVFHVCVPMQERVLSITIPGMHFRDLLAPYKLWETGTVYMVDEEGTTLASERAYLVANRYNFIREAKRIPGCVPRPTSPA